METAVVCKACGTEFNSADQGRTLCNQCLAEGKGEKKYDATLSYASAPLSVGDGNWRPFLPRIVNALLAKVRGLLNERAFEAIARASLLAGEITAYLALGLLFCAFAISALKTNSLIAALIGTAFCGGLLLALYVSLEMIVAGFRLLRASRTRITSGAYLNCFAVILLLAALACFSLPIIRFSSLTGPELIATFAIYWFAIVPSILGAMLALNPAVLNIEVTPDANAGETFIGLVSFLLKAWLALLPVELLLGAILTIFMALAAIAYLLFSSNPWAAVVNGALALTAATAQMTWAVLNPIMTTLLFLFFYLVVDLCQAVLNLPKSRAKDA